MTTATDAEIVNENSGSEEVIDNEVVDGEIIDMEETGREEMAFQADTKDLLNLMVNSIYTHKEIFLRELLSNASDAIDKFRFLTLTDSSLLQGDEEYRIDIEIDKYAKTLSISDNGIGMSFQDVIDHIGTIAKSGTRNFLKQIQQTQDLDLIGQFGVGFYSAFMVSKKVKLETRGYDQQEGVLWESNGEGTYTIKNIDREKRGTTITLYLRDDAADTKIPQKDFTNQYTIRNLVEEYSNYIQYPIKMDMTREEPPRDEQGNQIAEGEWTTVVENKVLNSMTPLWKKSKNEISDEEYFKFYKHHYKDWNEYADVVHLHIEGTIEYYALLYIPSHASSDLYSKDFAKGIQLYSNSVFVMNDCKDLLPDHFRFVRGLVDSKDFSLNISREILQHDAQLKSIGGNLEKKVISTLKKLLKNKREKYEEIWEEFGKAIKGGIYMDIGNRDKLGDLLLFKSSHNDNAYTTLREYCDRMIENQTEIYFAAGKDIDAIKRMPQLEIFLDKNIEVLYFTDKVDEFMAGNLDSYDNKKLVSVARENFDLDKVLGKKKKGKQADGEEADKNTDKAETEADEISELETEHGELLTAIKESLSDKVADVRLSKRLKNSPVCLVTSNSGTTFNMEQLLRGANQVAPRASKILEINPYHKLFGALTKTHKNRNETSDFADCCELIYYQALLVEGYELDDPVAFSGRIASLMANYYVS